VIPAPLKYRCDFCSRPLRVDRHICGACYKKGYSLNAPTCKKCGKPTSTRARTLCEECRKVSREHGQDRYVGRQAVLGPECDQIMLEAQIPLREDVYAQNAHVLTDEEVAAKREKFLSLLSADVHCGTYGQPSYHNHAAQRDGDAVGGFGTLAYQHMRGGVAGHGTDREHTLRARESRERRARRDS
jgi:hypothetical protein